MWLADIHLLWPQCKADLEMVFIARIGFFMIFVLLMELDEEEEEETVHSPHSVSSLWSAQSKWPSHRQSTGMHLVPSHWKPLVHTVQRVHQETLTESFLPTRHVFTRGFFFFSFSVFFLSFSLPFYFLFGFTWKRKRNRKRRKRNLEDQRIHGKWLMIDSRLETLSLWNSNIIGTV